VSRFIFAQIDVQQQGVITFIEFIEKFGSFKSAAKAWSTLFGKIPNNLKGVTQSDLKSTISNLTYQRNDLEATLGDFENISRVVKAIYQFVFWFFVITVLLLVAGVSPAKVLVTFSTLLAAGAIAFGNSLKVGFDSILFILYTKPYDVGDRVTLRIPNAPEMFVSRINVLTTSFVTSSEYKVVVIPNSELSKLNIYNFRRSSNAILSMYFGLGD
jgi:small-conductance mechanosensitive channel